MKNNLTESSQPSFRQADSDDETGSSSTHQMDSNDSFSNHIQAHVEGLSAEQRITGCVENSNSVEDICEGLKLSLPLAQLMNALRWDQHLYRTFPTIIKNADIWQNSVHQVFEGSASSNCWWTKKKELKGVEDNLTDKLIEQHASWVNIPIKARAEKNYRVNLSKAQL